MIWERRMLFPADGGDELRRMDAARKASRWELRDYIDRMGIEHFRPQPGNMDKAIDDVMLLYVWTRQDVGQCGLWGRYSTFQRVWRQCQERWSDTYPGYWRATMGAAGQCWITECVIVPIDTVRKAFPAATLLAIDLKLDGGVCYWMDAGWATQWPPRRI